MSGISTQPKDDNGYVIPSISGLKRIFNPGDPDEVTFKPITLPVDAKCIKIQASNGFTGDFTSFSASPPTFHFALTAAPALGEWTQHVGEFNFDCVVPSGTTVGFIKASIGTVISVMVGA